LVLPPNADRQAASRLLSDKAAGRLPPLGRRSLSAAILLLLLLIGLLSERDKAGDSGR
jgi:hypothetical protein